MNNHVDFESLGQSLLNQSESLLYTWFPAGVVKGSEFEIGDLSGSAGRSLRVNVRTGRWKDFAAGVAGGDLISLYAAIHGVSQVEAVRLLSGTPPKQSIANGSGQAKPTPSVSFMQPPKGTKKPDFVHSVHGAPTSVWPYRNSLGEVLFFIARYDVDGGKEFSPFSWTGEKWVRKAWPDSRPLYGLELLTQFPDRAVLVVEGERACDAARLICGNVYCVVSWSGGASAWKKTDWSALSGRKVLLWPDADKPGIGVMELLGESLLGSCPEVKVLSVSDLPTGHDAADMDMDWNGFKAWAKPRVHIMRPMQTDSVADIDITSSPPSSLQKPFHVSVEPTSAVVNLPSADVVKAGLPDCPEGGRPRCTIRNVKALLDQIGVIVRYNVVSKREEIIIPGGSFSIDNCANATLAHILSWCNDVGMPIGQVQDFITYLADSNPYNPVATWIMSKPWDGVSRLEDLYSTVKAKNEDGDPLVLVLKKAMIKRWLISAAAATFSPNGVSAHGVLVFQGDQYIGKTQWFKRLAPKELEVIADGMTLKPDDKDSVKQVVSFWLVELGELDATFRKADIAQLKSFLTKDKDILRVAYARRESEFARRTVFFGSVNASRFLHDNTGNRRFWTVECESINYEHTIDVQQLWAEVRQLYMDGNSWFLTREEMVLLNDHNESFQSTDPVEESIGSDLRWHDDTQYWRWATVTQILKELNFKGITQSDLNKASREIAKRNGNKRRKSNGQQLIFAPQRDVRDTKGGSNPPDIH